MEWTPGGLGDDVEDRRDDSGGGGGGGFNFGGGGIGIVGFLVLLVISLITGRNFLGGFLGGSSNPVPTQPTQSMQSAPATGQNSSAQDRDAQLIAFTLNDVQKTWTGIFQQEGWPAYRHAKLVLFRGSTYSGCGTAEESTGPFYCPSDEKVYIDLDFWDELRQLGGSTADFAQAYVIAHELGHHVQKLRGVEQKVERLDQQTPSGRNPLSVEVELQADCYGGVWAHSAQQRGIVDPGDVDAALSAVAAVGDDHIQKMSERAVSPESWTHGSSAQRQQWFRAGFNSGDPASCTTFNGSIQP